MNSIQATPCLHAVKAWTTCRQGVACKRVFGDVIQQVFPRS
ncbi:hypothetical protein [Bacteroides sp. HPS0048]